MDIWILVLIIVLVALLVVALLRWQAKRRSGHVIAEKHRRQER